MSTTKNNTLRGQTAMSLGFFAYAMMIFALVGIHAFPVLLQSTAPDFVAKYPVFAGSLVARYHPTKAWRRGDRDRNGSHAAC